MIHIVQGGDLFSSGAHALVNPVNCLGVSGAGLALEFKRRYPLNDRMFRAYCLGGSMSPGNVYITRIEGYPVIYNAATKGDWRLPSIIAYVDSCIRKIRDLLRVSPELSSIAIPALGCGKGGLEWEDVKWLLLHYLADMEEKEIWIYSPILNFKG